MNKLSMSGIVLLICGGVGVYFGTTELTTNMPVGIALLIGAGVLGVMGVSAMTAGHVRRRRGS